MKQEVIKALSILDNAYNADEPLTARAIGEARKAEASRKAYEYEQSLLIGAYAIGDIREI